MNEQVKKSINIRYSNLAKQSCCLSCGGALSYADVKEGEICLDLGSGRGPDVIRMAEAAGPDGFAYGIDIADGMLEKAKKNIQKFHIKNAKVMKAELEHLPFDDRSIDVVISNCTINHSRDKAAVFRETARVLSEDGRIVISDIYSLSDVPSKYADDPVAVAECWAGAITKDKYIQILEEAGFHDVTIVEESEPYPKGEISVCSFTFIAKK
jgi:ubiquinone/menaquinone biosynthesis C-methylase UbiE